jgi:hypothetical protein
LYATYTHATAKFDAAATVKYVPEWFPGAGFQKKAKLWRQYVDEMRIRPFEVVKQDLVSVMSEYVNFRIP